MVCEYAEIFFTSLPNKINRAIITMPFDWNISLKLEHNVLKVRLMCATERFVE